MLKRICAVPVGILTYVLFILSSPTMIVWALLVASSRVCRCPLPQGMERLRLPHTTFGRLAEQLWRNRRLTWR